MTEQRCCEHRVAYATAVHDLAPRAFLLIWALDVGERDVYRLIIAIVQEMYHKQYKFRPV
eukprot:1671544-Pleurochrysis_carterae.AAC.1